MVITESAVASTRLLGLGSKLYPKHHTLHAQQRFYSIDSCSLSRARQKKDCVGGVYVNMLLLNLYFIYATFYFFTYVLRRIPGTRRCLKTTYSIRMYSVPPLLQFVSLQNTTASGNVCACVKLAGKYLLTGNRNGRKPF